ncbi:MAG: XrtA-associated tyrosine autokinase [Bacteroidota bacterium]
MSKKEDSNSRDGFSESASEELVVKMPERSDDLKEVISKLESGESETGVEDQSAVDIRLDQDLSDFSLPLSKSIYKEVALDIDLTGPFGNEGEFVEQEYLDVNPLKQFSQRVEIDLNRLERNGYISPGQADSELSHTFRVLKRPLLNNVLGKGATQVLEANLIMVTSSLSGEGKTFTALNLALSMAMEKDKKILLVDADVNKPSHHEILGVEPDFGLTDYLTDRVKDVSKVIKKTNIPSLSLMFSGARTPHTVELFASDSMTRFLEELANRYDDRIIIFDSAPLLMPTESSVLATHMGQVIIVVEAEMTGQELVKRSVDMLDNRIKLLALNKVREKGDFANYGFYGDPMESQ